MAACDNVPLASQITEFAADMAFVQTFVETDALTATTPQGKVRQTIAGALAAINADAAAVDASRIAAQAAIAADVADVDASRVSAQAAIAADVAAVDAAATSGLPAIAADVTSVQTATEEALTVEIPAQIARLGLQYPPIAYTAGTTLDSNTKTYSYNDALYIWGGALGTVTTGAFDETGWQPIQGDIQLRDDVEAGTSLIRDVKHVASVTALRALPGRYNGQVVELTSYYAGWAATARGPVGGGVMVWDASSTATDKGAHEARVFAVSGVTVGRWIRPIEGELWDTQAGSYNNMINDDTAAVQSCIDTLAGLGGGVVRLSQEVLMGGVEILTNGISIIGLGKDGTLVKYTGTPAGGSVAAFSFGQPKSGSGALTPVSGAVLQGMTIDGNRAGGAIGSAARLTVFDGLTLRDVHTYDCAQSYGIAIVGTGATPRKDLLIENCSALRCGADGLDIKAGGERLVVRGFVTGDHLNETSGDSVGIDIRGQYISVTDVFCFGCLEFNFRVRINIGVQQSGDTDWSQTEKAKVSINNVFSIGGRDGVLLSSPLNSVVNASGVHSQGASRYGIATAGVGTVFISDSSSTDNLVGVLPSIDGHLYMSNVAIDRNTQDGLAANEAVRVTMRGGSISKNGRYGIQQVATPINSHWKFSGVTIDGNLTNYIVNSSSANGLVEFDQTDVINATSRGLQISATSPVKIKFKGGNIAGNATNLHTLNAQTKFDNVEGVISRNNGEQSFAVDSVGVKTVTVSHGITSGAPDIGRVSVSLLRDTPVDDYAVDFVRVDGISSTQITFRVKVSSSSATAGATAKLSWSLDSSY